MQILDLVHDFGRPPLPWAEGRTIPWDDPGFSERMLAQHLSQAHDGASRRQELIEKHVEFTTRTALPATGGRVLDLGCGPGLYCHRLAVLGHSCVGVDFSPASIDYARYEASSRSLDCRFELADIRDFETAGSFDVVLLLFGELNLFIRAEAVELLRRCADVLAPGGRLLLEVHSFDKVRSIGTAAPKWSAVESGIFSERPHMRLEESFWLEDAVCAAGRHWVVDAETSAVSKYGWTMQAYSEAEYDALLADAGLKLDADFASLTGLEDGAGFPVLLASRR